MNSIHKEVTITKSRDDAFKKFVQELNKWWPKEYTWSRDCLEDIYIDARKNGLCTEIGPHEFRCDWGRVTVYQESEEIQLKWQIGPNREPVPNPDRASDIIIKFSQQVSAETVIHFEHFNFENHGEKGEWYRKMMDSEQGWDYILECFRKYCE